MTRARRPSLLPAALTLTLALGLALAPAPPAVAEQPSQTAESARIAALSLLDAIDGMAEAERARDRIAALTETIRAHEAGLSALRAGLRDVSLRETAIRRQFVQESAALSRVLGAMMAIESIDPPALMMHPEGPLAAARAGMMLADLAPAMQAEADRIGAMLAELESLQALQSTALDTLNAGLESLQGARIALSQAVADRRDLPANLSADEERMLALLASVETLEAFALALDDLADRGAAPDDGQAAPGFTDARGALPLPVRGQLLRAAGEADAAGIARPGLTLATEPGALVQAPWAATVRYRGPLLDYENVILIEPAPGYLMVAAGMGSVFPRVGDVVAAGAALGMMPGAVTGEAEFATQFATQGDSPVNRSETLYLELREGGQAIDPGAWFDLTGTEQPGR